MIKIRHIERSHFLVYAEAVTGLLADQCIIGNI